MTRGPWAPPLRLPGGCDASILYRRHVGTPRASRSEAQGGNGHSTSGRGKSRVLQTAKNIMFHDLMTLSLSLSLPPSPLSAGLAPTLPHRCWMTNGFPHRLTLKVAWVGTTCNKPWLTDLSGRQLAKAYISSSITSQAAGGFPGWRLTLHVDSLKMGMIRSRSANRCN